MRLFFLVADNDSKALTVSKTKRYTIDCKGFFERGDGVIFDDDTV